MAIRVRVLATACIALALALVTFVAPASAASLQGTVQPGGAAYVELDFPGPVATCQLQAATAGGPTFTLGQALAVGTRIEWLWVVPADAAPDSWTVTADCGGASLTTQLTVAGAGGTRPALASDVHAVVSLTALPPVTTLLTQLVAPLSQAWWSANEHALLGAFQQGSAAGQCTAYAARRRPDLIARVDTWARAQAIRSGATRLPVDWTARSWAADAQRAGLTVARTAAPNAVMVFQPGAYGAGRDGHVAVVDRVGADGSFAISEMHAPQPHRLTARRFTARQARALRRDPRVSFILGPPRG